MARSKPNVSCPCQKSPNRLSQIKPSSKKKILSMMIQCFKKGARAMRDGIDSDEEVLKAYKAENPNDAVSYAIRRGIIRAILSCFDKMPLVKSKHHPQFSG